MFPDDYQTDSGLTTGVALLPDVRIVDIDPERRVFVPRRGLAWKVTHVIAHDYWHIESADRGVIEADEERGRRIVAACRDCLAQLESR